MIERYNPGKELKDFDFPAVVERNFIYDIWLDRKLPLELFLKHNGHKITAEGDEYTLQIENSKWSPNDTLKLEIESYRGISIGAQHWYGHLDLPSICFKKKGSTSLTMCAGFLPTFLKKVQLHRQVTSEETRSDDRYKKFKAGDWTFGFNSVEDIVQRAKVISERHFSGFKLLIPDLSQFNY